MVRNYVIGFVILVCALSVMAKSTTMPAQSVVRVGHDVCALVEPDLSSSNCYTDAATKCHEKNTGKCFSTCLQNAQNKCFSMMRSSCALPQGFENKYMVREECKKDLPKLCAAQCMTKNALDDCKRQSTRRCSHIGKIFG